MTQTQTLTRPPEAAPAAPAPTPEATKARPELPKNLKPLETELTTRNIAELDALNVEFQNKINDAWSKTFNRAYKEAIEHGVDSAKAHRLADAEAMAVARSAALAELGDKVAVVARRFMPEADFADPNFDAEAYGDRYNNVYKAVLNVAEMDESEWLGDYKPDGSRKGNGVLHKMHEVESWIPPTPENNDVQEMEIGDVELSPELKEEKGKLDKLREAKRKASVELQGTPLWSRKKLATARENYQKALDEYKAQFQEFLRKLAEFYRTKNVAEDKVNLYLTSETNRYAREDLEAEKEQLIEKGGLWARLGEKYTQLSTPKKVLAGFAIGAAGAGLGAVLGGAGIAITVVGAVRMARTYGLGMARLYGRQIDIPEFRLEGSGGDIHAQAANYLTKRAEASVEEAKKLRRRAVGLAMASVAIPGVGAAAGTVIAHYDSLGGFIGGYSGRAVEAALDHTPDAPKELPKAAKAEVEIRDINPKDQIRDLLPDTPAAEKLMKDPNFFKDGKFNIPIRPGDGFIRLGERYGFTDAQTEKMMEIVAKHKGETYRVGSDVRLNLGDRQIKLTPSELKAILSAK